MTNLKLKQLEMQKKKAEAVIAELEFKIEERREDIKRMEEHINQQEKLLQEIQTELGGAK